MTDSGLQVAQREGATVATVGDVAAMEPPAVEALVSRLYSLADRGRGQRIILDLTPTVTLTPLLLGAMVTLQAKVNAIGGRLIVCSLSADAAAVLRESRLQEVLTVAPNVEEALRAFQPEAGGEAGEAKPGRWGGILARQVRIFFAGAIVVVPLAITVWVLWSVGAWLDNLGYEALARLGLRAAGEPGKRWNGLGALLLVGVIYVLGLMTHVWVFRGLFGLIERLLTRVPGVKTIYESVRDLMRLFGGGSQRMGRVVQVELPATGLAALGILTNERPAGLSDDQTGRMVAVYLPYSYMFGGPTLYVSKDNVKPVDMTAEQCLKICATAQVGAETIAAAPPKR